MNTSFKNRHLKIFISSTFEDMHNEREILLKDVFLKLKNIAKQRDIDITEIDLRWGITSEEADSGHTVKICLDEIERCKDSPIFFLGMLGNRYGWSDWHRATHLKFLNNEKYSWIKKYFGKSITELEISYAIKENNTHNRVFLFLKEDKKDDDIRLKNLKNDLRTLAKQKSAIYLDNYTNIDDFKEKVFISMQKALDEIFPIDEKITELEKLRYTHYIFAKTRQKLYIPHKKNEKILDNFLQSNKDKLLIYGSSGLGKTALIANYIKKIKGDNNYFIIEHYIGGAGELSSDLYHMLKRVMLEIKEKFKISDNIPTEPEKILSDFTVWLSYAKKPTLIILDGYNQIDDEDKIKLFAYLPEKLKNVKLIITSIKDDYPIENKYKILPLDKTEQKNLINSYFRQYGKKLTLKTIDKIINHRQTDNTLFLKTLLEEIRLLNRFETLEEDIEKYLYAKDVQDLFIKIFKRLENDYGFDLVEEVLSLIWVSRDGLSENNIFEIIHLNRTNKKLTRLEFSPLFLAIQEHLVNRNGMYSFFHSYIEEAVKYRYLSDENKIKKYREWIANYFIDKPIDKQRIRELPYQLYKIGSRDKLFRCLNDIEFFVKVYELNEYEMLKYVQYLGRSFLYSLREKLYKLNPEEQSKYIDTIAYFLCEIYIDYEISLELYKYSLKLKLNKSSCENLLLAKGYDNVGLIYYLMGNIKAIEYFEKSIEIKKNLPEPNLLEIADTYINLGLSYEHFNKYDKTLLLYTNALKILEKELSKYDLRLGVLYNNLGELYRLLKQYKKAEKYYKKDFQITNHHFLGKHHYKAVYYNNMGILYKDKKKYKKSLFLFKKALSIYLSILGKSHAETMRCFANIAETLNYLNKDKISIKYDKTALKLRKKYLPQNHYEIGVSYNNLAYTYKKKKLYNKSKLFYYKAIQIFNKDKHSNEKYLHKVYDNLKKLKLFKRKLKR